MQGIYTVGGHRPRDRFVTTLRQTISDLMQTKLIYCTDVMRQKNLDTNAVSQTDGGRGKEEEQREGRNCRTVPGKEHPRVREEGKKMG